MKRVFTLSNLVVLLTVALGVAASAGVTDSFYPSQKVLIALVTMVAAQLLIDRVGILRSIHDRVVGANDGYHIEMLPRSSRGFERFADFARHADEIMVVGVDLAFMANADAWFVQKALDRGVTIKLLMCDPSAGVEVQEMLDNHDERNIRTPQGLRVVHHHIPTAAQSLLKMRSMMTATTRGSLEIRARTDIPSPTISFVDPQKRHGKVRVELKLFKKNHGDVPYFVVTRSSEWYDVFVRHYYIKLWEDSKPLP